MKCIIENIKNNMYRNYFLYNILLYCILNLFITKLYFLNLILEIMILNHDCRGILDSFRLGF